MRKLKRGLVSLLMLCLIVTTATFTPMPSRFYGSSLSAAPVWYTDPNLRRSGTSIIDEKIIEEAQFIFIQKGERGTHHMYLEINRNGETSAMPLFLKYKEVKAILGGGLVKTLADQNDNKSMLLWIGERSKVKYFAVYESNGSIKNAAMKAQMVLDNTFSKVTPKLAPLREFGDRIPSSMDSATYSTANALVEFHKSHKFCSYCGSPTNIRKHGASRVCSKHKSLGGNCSSPSIYPRIDLASIMLVTSQCNKYCLLGRKRSWPKGRYSTLAGFLEVGETIEDCFIRETFEESGIRVDVSSVQFLKSQPWPFPRSLMVGFRGKASKSHEENEDESGLPLIKFDEKEMEDVRWFHRDYVSQRLDGGSTALLYEPGEDELEFHIPGKASLARLLITDWALEEE